MDTGGQMKFFQKWLIFCDSVLCHHLLSHELDERQSEQGRSCTPEAAFNEPGDVPVGSSAEQLDLLTRPRGLQSAWSLNP
jgi:hypothetical protein